MTILAIMFVLIMTVFYPGRGQVTTTSDPMDLATCHSEMAKKMAEAGDKLVTIRCDAAP
jgi:hypothetical protein